MDKQLKKIIRESDGFKEYYHSYVEYLHELLNRLNDQSIENVVNVFLEARERESTIFFAGNGGSAATASHFSQDLAQIGNKLKCKGFRSLSLTDNTSHITAAGNDCGFDSIFTEQMSFLFQERDVLVAISASGNSPNVMNAAKLAKDKGGITVALVGFDGGELLEHANHVIHLKTPKGEYGPVEDAHMILDHIITTYLMGKLKSQEG